MSTEPAAAQPPAGGGGSVGLYIDPPDKARAFSVGEKRQIQALDRTQPSLPLKNCRYGTMTHDYKRHRTTIRFEALATATGPVTGPCMPRNPHLEGLRSLRRIDAKTPKHLDAHLIGDNDATHKHAKVRAWLTPHPRFHMHFTSTSASWISLVEHFFRLITAVRIRCGAFNPDFSPNQMQWGAGSERTVLQPRFFSDP